MLQAHGGIAGLVGLSVATGYNVVFIILMAVTFLGGLVFAVMLRNANEAPSGGH